MKYLLRISIVACVLGAVSLGIGAPTEADTVIHPNVTHQVWMQGYGLFDVVFAGSFCIPTRSKTELTAGDLVSVVDTRECPDIPFEMKKVLYKNMSGWTWDFVLRELSEDEIPEEPVPIYKEETEEENMDVATTTPETALV